MEPHSSESRDKTSFIVSILTNETFLRIAIIPFITLIGTLLFKIINPELKSKDTIIVPKLIGLTEDSLDQIINEEKFNIQKHFKKSLNKPYRTVVNQTPKAQTKIQKEQAINAYISVQASTPGSTQVTVPNIEGQIWDSISVKKQLDSLKLLLGNTQKEISKEIEGTIIKTEPEAYSNVKKNSSIDIIIARKAIIPRTVDMTTDSAIIKIREEKLIPKVKWVNKIYTPSEKIVKSQIPKEGSSANPGEEVILNSLRRIPIDSALIAYFRFNEYFHDEINNSSIIESINTSIRGNALYLNSSEKYKAILTLPENKFNINDFTMSLNFMARGIQKPNKNIISGGIKKPWFSLGWNKKEHLTISLNNSDNHINKYLSTKIKKNKWYNIIITVSLEKSNKKTIEVIFNGERLPTWKLPEQFNFNFEKKEKNKLTFRNYSQKIFFKGCIDNLRIFNKSLDSIEIDSLYSQHLQRERQGDGAGKCP
ncbi:MAG: PASTA domain-containing protein [Chlorobiales bacterium]|nr:PASTA domain-containing protein [Chlorobiales bacterium]